MKKNNMLFSKKAISSIVAIALLLLLSAILFSVLYSWVTSFDSQYTIAVEKNALEIDIKNFKNDTITITANSNTQLQELSISKDSQQICEITQKNISKQGTNISLSSCSLTRGDIYHLQIFTAQQTKSQYQVYR